MKTKQLKPHVAELLDLRACSDAVSFADGFQSLQAAWDACERGDWMLWLAGKRAGARARGSEKRKQLVLAACACARLALPHVRTGETRSTFKQCADLVRQFYPEVPQ